MTYEEGWKQNFELLKAYIEEHHHGFDRLTTGLPDKMVRQAHQPIGKQRAAFVGKISKKEDQGWCSGRGNGSTSSPTNRTVSGTDGE